MSVDATKVQFYSGWPIDKIFLEGTISGAVPACTDPVGTPILRTLTVPNTYGSAGFVTAAYSIDGTNFYGQDVTLYYYDTITAQIYPEITVTPFCTASTVSFLLISTFRSILNVTIHYAVDSLT